jgi:hypothetical protein
MGLEVVDTPDARPGGIPSSPHTAACAIRFSLDTAPVSLIRRWDEASGARSVGEPLRGTRLLWFQCVLPTISLRLDVELGNQHANDGLKRHLTHCDLEAMQVD